MLQADVRAQRVVVQGTVIGSVRATVDVEVVPGGKVIGDVAAERLVVHEGAVLEGYCTVGPSRIDHQRRSTADA
jgi:cytoskeletal protein CcmA (bactofilin family)